MAASYLQSSMDKIAEARDPKLIELCINPDGTWIVTYCECPRAAAESIQASIAEQFS